ncbi:hypothetical protein AKJ08_0968 [Vulgatibacter incomptus]|uniref:DUF1328 domain-containing protein n=1 Tax=Vulgatibacter incomptus TaxID=1391653 RepID=A0A0K1PAZ1_9BACT|nr:hypothetical protein AKJ08_0968 [Vulgatibacter incomptus]
MALVVLAAVLAGAFARGFRAVVAFFAVVFFVVLVLVAISP